MFKRILGVYIFLFTAFSFINAYAAMDNYCAVPPFVSSQAPPLVMLVMGRDHKLHYEAYNDAFDLDEDGTIDIGYKHSLDYYGYFDSYKCYTYDTTNKRFNPTSTTSDKYCSGSTSEWSGNFLNWLSMSRMDAIRKVLYGGKRSTDTSSETVLEGSYTPRDAHSWGKEYYKSDMRKLSPYNGTSQLECSVPSTPATWNINDKILRVLYEDGSSKGCGTDHADLISTFSVTEFDSMTYLDAIDISSGNNHIENGNYMFVTKIKTDSNRTLHFKLLSDDGADLEIDGVVEATNYGCHGITDQSDTVTGSKVFVADTEYVLIVRVREQTGQDGAILYYSTDGGTNYKLFSASNLSADNISLNAPNVSDTASGHCRFMESSFVNSGVPSSSGDYVSNITSRNLFCMTSDDYSNKEPHMIKVALNKTQRIWEWASKERPVCADSDNNGIGTPYAKLYVRVKVCDSTVGLEENCKAYGSSYKPDGLLQAFGKGEGDKICSKTMTSVDKKGECDTEEGLPIYRAPMYFGLITGSYEKNLSGGVMRKNIWDFRSEINDDGTFKTAANMPTQGSIIETINNLKTTNYNNSSYSDCGWITTRSINEGECNMWGNPIGEMMYETMRYFSGQTSPLSAFTYSTSTDNGLSLPNPGWTATPYSIFPTCSKPFVMMISDTYPSYDDDGVPETDINLTNYNKTSAYSAITANENINGSYFIGANAYNSDFICTAKNLTNIADAKGLCPEEPTKKGTFNTAALAYYGNTQFSSNYTESVKNIGSYSIAMNSPVPDIKIKVGSNTVRLVPVGKSPSGCLSVDSACKDKCTQSYVADSDGDKNLIISNCTSDANCPSNTIVDFYSEYITDKKGKFRINFEDVEQGADHDMDAIVEYTYEVISDTQVKITLNTTYSAGCIDQAMGFVISGTTKDGAYLPVRDTDASAHLTTTLNMPTSWTKTFTVGSTATADIMKDPLWLAAKYGGFNDKNSNNIPDLQAEWDENEDGVPDNYFYVTNPLKLEKQLTAAFVDILKETSSGTSVSILSERRRKGSMLAQAVFFPQKDFGQGIESVALKWIGQLFTFWFYNDKTVQNIREDTDKNFILDVCKYGGEGDKIIDFQVTNFGNLSLNQYKSDCDGNPTSTTDFTTVYMIEDSKYIWQGGEKLADTSADNRTIFTSVDNNTLIPFHTDNMTSFNQYFGDSVNWHSCLNNDNATLISYIRGTDVSGCRTRTTHEGKVYKLGDIMYSTPMIVDYEDYSLVFTGANDGMLHAFRLGKVDYSYLKGFQAARLCNKLGDCETDEVGQEEWAFIPKNALPYLRYLADPSYCHLYYTDLPPYLIELDTNNDGYPNKKILIGGMRFGGGCGKVATDSVNPPSDTCADPTSSTCVGRSSYFALDITDPENPDILWEFDDPDLAFSYSGPAFVQRSGNYFIVFGSGPTSYDGAAAQDLKFFVLSVDSSTFEITKITKFDGAGKSGFIKDSSLSSYNQAFSGRLFTDGVDYDSDGNTDTIFVGANQLSGSTWAGNVIAIDVQNTNPELWTFGNAFNSAIEPITARIVHSECFGMNYIYFGTGRWFFKLDEEGANSNDTETIYGMRIDGCMDGKCNLNSAHTSADSCDKLDANVTVSSWKIDLAPKDTTYIKERLISDPSAPDGWDTVFYSTTQPSGDICSFGGRSRLWGVNCATGLPITVGCPGDTYKTAAFTSTIYLQLSKGNIEDIKGADINQNGNLTTQWYTGITPETPPVVPPGYQGGKQGQIIFWLEK